MDRLNIIMNELRERLAIIADWLYGCPHRRTTFPITTRVSVTVDGQQSTQSEAYAACLDCGRHLPYDSTTMRETRRGGPFRNVSGLKKCRAFALEPAAAGLKLQKE